MSLNEAIRGAARRADASPWPFVVGEIVSYDPTTHWVVAQYDVTDRTGQTFQQQTPPSQLMVPWWGEGYGDQSGPEPGAQCIIAILDPQGSEFIVLGFTSNDINPGFSTPGSERQILDKRGSFVWWTAARSGALRVFGAAIATIFGGTATEVGGENLNATNDAIVTKRYLDARIAALQTELTTWASAHLSNGSGASGPTLGATAQGSSKARAVP